MDHAQASKVMGDMLMLAKMTGSCERVFLKARKQKSVVEAAGLSYKEWKAFIVTDPGRRLLQNFFTQCSAQIAAGQSIGKKAPVNKDP